MGRGNDAIPTYLRYKDNAIIRELKASPKRLYMALFYRQEIELLNKKESLIKELNKSKELLMNYSNNVWSVDETLFNKIKIKAEIIAQIKTLLLNQKKEQSQLDDADKVLAQMTKARMRRQKQHCYDINLNMQE